MNTPDDYEEVDTTGNIRALTYLGLDPVHDALLFRVTAGPAGPGPDRPCGTWTLSVATARELLVDLVLALRDLEGPETPH